MTWKSVNPATGEPLGEYAEMDRAEVLEIVRGAHEAHREWRRADFAHRAERMRRAATLLRERADDYGRLVTREMGKPLSEARAEVEKCAWVCEHYADHAGEHLAPEPVDTPGTGARTLVAYEPLGVILAIMPWNFPFWQVFRFAAPNLMAGNAGVLKHASNVGGCALAIEEVFRDAGFPPDLFRALFIGRELAAEAMQEPLVRGVTLTGSVAAGRSVAASAGSHVKKTVLELGGSDPYLVLEDADLERTIDTCVASRLINGGQSCIAAKRFIVVSEVREAFEKGMRERMGRKVVGDPLEEDTDIGPLARRDLRDELHEQVKRSVEAGARLLLGGEVPEGPGAFYPPTVLGGVKPGMPAYHEELFGPVASIMEVRDEAEAIRVANDSDFGLGAAVFTQDLERGERIATKELDAGACFVNGLVRSDPRLPFGGVKESGYGRELALHGIREFVNVKAVWVEGAR